MLISFIFFAVLLKSCFPVNAPRYSSSVTIVNALQALGDKKISVGKFSSSDPTNNKITCRAIGFITPPNGEPFVDYVRNAFIEELTIAKIYSDTSLIILTAYLDKIEFSSHYGRWDLAITITSSNGKSMSVAERYEFNATFDGERACDYTARSLAPAVQNLLRQAVLSHEFASLLE